MYKSVLSVTFATFLYTLLQAFHLHKLPIDRSCGILFNSIHSNSMTLVLRIRCYGIIIKHTCGRANKSAAYSIGTLRKSQWNTLNWHVSEKARFQRRCGIKEAHTKQHQQTPFITAKMLFFSSYAAWIFFIPSYIHTFFTAPPTSLK